MQSILDISVAASSYFFVALSITILLKIEGYIDFSIGASVSTGAALVYLFYSVLQFPIIISIIGTVSAGLLLTWFIYWQVFRRFTIKGSPGSIKMIAGLGVYIVITNLLSLSFGDAIRTISLDAGDTMFYIFGARLSLVQISSIIVAISIGIVLFLFLYFTMYGKVMRAVIDNAKLAEASGLNITAVRWLAITIGSVSAILAGVFATLDIGFSPTMGMHFLLMGAVASFLGGTQFVGTLYGSVFLAVLQHSSILLFPAKWADSITFSVLIIILLAIPSRFIKSMLSDRV